MNSIESINSKEFVSMDDKKLMKCSKDTSRSILEKDILRVASPFEELGPKNVEANIRNLKHFRETYHNSHVRWDVNLCIHDILPDLVRLWWLNTLILNDEYYRELVDTIMFLARIVGPLNMIEVIVGNLMQVQKYVVVADQEKLLKKQFYKIALETIAKMTLMKAFDCTNVPPFSKQVLIDIIRKYEKELIQDSVMQDSIITIVNNLYLDEELMDSRQPIDADEQLAFKLMKWFHKMNQYGPNSPEESMDSKESMSQSMGQSIDTDQSTDIESLESSQEIDGYELNNSEESMSQSINSDKSIDIKKQQEKEYSILFDNYFGNEPALPDTLRDLSFFETVPSFFIEQSIRILQDYRTDFRDYWGRCLNDRYIQEVLPKTLRNMSFNIVILKGEYYRELVKTVMFLAGVLGSQVMIKIVVENQMEIDGYFVSGDQSTVRLRCRMMAMDTILKMISMADFNPTEMCPIVEQACNKFILEYEKEEMKDPISDETTDFFLNDFQTGKYKDNNNWA